MPELTIPEAAAALGISVDTVRRRLKRGQLQSRQDDRGRLLVQVEAVDADAGSGLIASSDFEHVRQELEHTKTLLAEVRHQRDRLEQELQSRTAEHSTAEAELRRLLGNEQLALQQLQRLLPSPQEATGGPETPAATQNTGGETGGLRKLWNRVWGS